MKKCFLESLFHCFFGKTYKKKRVEELESQKEKLLEEEL
jgi:hypothetical protein